MNDQNFQNFNFGIRAPYLRMMYFRMLLLASMKDSKVKIVEWDRYSQPPSPTPSPPEGEGEVEKREKEK